ncbi:TolC family protein [Desulforegula conservatrix]|uniref:TolC family protein n=1 Tax=Desulforegula conservatrix TaxID=153026 RepID=UPI0004090B67|nr:TolC family protein [Desulforegula conservatrix]
MRKLISLFLVIPMFFGFQKIPESMAGERLSLNKAISMAYSASQSMKKTSEQLEGSIQAEKSVNADFLPKAEASYSLRQYQDVPYAQNGAVILKRSDRTHAEWGVGLIQPLFTGFALSSRLEIAKLGTAAMEEERVATRLNVVEGVKKAYYNLLLTRRILDVADEAVENLKAHESDAAKYYAQGVIPLNDLLKTKVELANAIQEKEKAEAGRRMAAASLLKL